MTTRERILAVLHYESYDRLPIVNFGFLETTIARWAAEGHIDLDDLGHIHDATPGEQKLGAMLGFDCNYQTCFRPNSGPNPPFEEKVLEELPNGLRKMQNSNGTIVLDSDDNTSIPTSVDHILKGRPEWDEHFLPRLQFSQDRVDEAVVQCDDEFKTLAQGGVEYLNRNDRNLHVLFHLGGLYGALRDWVGVENLCHLMIDDEKLLDEMIEVNGELKFRLADATLAAGAVPDIGHFWEDICFKNGPLVNPEVFAAKVGPHYRRITERLNQSGINLVSLDCDGLIDSLIPTWLDNGVNVMFPIEVGTWGASIKPWREKYGRELRGVGGMAKRIFGQDQAAIDAEIERLKALVDLGGYLPCPDHRISPEAKWDNVRYYCDRMRAEFSN